MMSGFARLPPMSLHALLSSRFLRFCAVGAASTGGSLAMFWALMSLGHVRYLPAFALTFCVMNAFGYVASRRAAFSGTRSSMQGGLARYFGVAAFMLAVNTAGLRGLVGGLGWHPIVGSIALALANAPCTYLLHRRITFRLHAAKDQVTLSR